jgi:chemotaxis protein MotA
MLSALGGGMLSAVSDIGLPAVLAGNIAEPHFHKEALVLLRNYIVPAGAVMALMAGAIWWPEFVHVPSLALTLGGSLIVTGISYSRTQLCCLLGMLNALWFEDQASRQQQIEILAKLTRLYRLQGLKGLEHAEHHLRDPFLKQAVTMLVDLRREERIHAKLDHLLASFVSQSDTARQILLTLGKLLPAFGLIGTLMGMVLLLRDMPGHQVAALPAALSLAVLTTLYGAVLANVVVAPLAARLQTHAAEKEMMMRMTEQWAMMLVRGETAVTITGKLMALSSPEHEARTGMLHSVAVSAQR